MGAYDRRCKQVRFRASRNPNSELIIQPGPKNARKHPNLPKDLLKEKALLVDQRQPV